MTKNDVIYVIINGIIILGLAYFTNLKVYGKSYVEKMRDPKIPARRLRKDMKEKLNMEIDLAQSIRLSYMIIGNIRTSVNDFYNDSRSRVKSYEYYSKEKTGVTVKDLKVLVRTDISDDGSIIVDIMNIDSLVDGGVVRYEFEYFTVFKLKKENE